MILQKLWEKNPLFYFGLCFMLGVATAIKFYFIYCFPLGLLIFFSRFRLQAIFIFLIASCYTYYTQPTFPFLNEEIYGKGKFTVESIVPSQTPFQRGLCLKGIMVDFVSDQYCFSSLPCSIFVDKMPSKGRSWKIEGTLVSKSPFHSIFKPNKKQAWEVLDQGFSWAHFRFTQKEKVRHFFEQRIKEKSVSHLFSIMATGDINDLLLSHEFQKLGLSHLLAISGLHFALIATALGKGLRLFFSHAPTFCLVWAFLGLFCIFLGGSPSILRAFMMISLWICSRLLKREIRGLNCLGAALLVELLLHPLSLTSLSFQLTFLATGGILLYYSFFQNIFTKFLPKRDLLLLSTFSRLQQHIYLSLHYIRSALSLNAAVHFTTILTLLYIFHSFPLLSLFYNLFVPSFLMISMLCIPLGIILPFCEKLNIYFTKFLLQMISNPPEIINYTFLTPPFSYTILIFLMTGIIFVGCLLCAIDQKNAALQNDWFY